MFTKMPSSLTVFNSISFSFEVTCFEISSVQNFIGILFGFIYTLNYCLAIILNIFYTFRFSAYKFVAFEEKGFFYKTFTTLKNTISLELRHLYSLFFITVDCWIRYFVRQLLKWILEKVTIQETQNWILHNTTII